MGLATTALTEAMEDARSKGYVVRQAWVNRTVDAMTGASLPLSITVACHEGWLTYALSKRPALTKQQDKQLSLF